MSKLILQWIFRLTWPSYFCRLYSIAREISGYTVWKGGVYESKSINSSLKVQVNSFKSKSAGLNQNKGLLVYVDSDSGISQ